MGLACSHDAFRGAYSAFNRLRQCVAAAAGGSYPSHYVYGPHGVPEEDPKTGLWKRHKDLDDDLVYTDDAYTKASHPGLFEFLAHSDCDGEIAPDMCVKVADDLEALLPKVEALGWQAGGHIAARGGFVEVLRKFIAGCRAAAAANEPLEFY